MTTTSRNRARSFARILAGWGVLAAALLSILSAASPAAAKTPGSRYCFGGVCHRVLTLGETRGLVGKVTHAVTSFYDDCRRDRYNPCGLTSSGEAFKPGETNSAASPLLPDGTIIVVRNPRNGESAIVRINNAGPYWGNRTLDLSRAAGLKLGLGKVGVARVEVTVLKAPNKAEATYRRNRTYPALPGHVGRFASLSDAHSFAIASLDVPVGAEVAKIVVAHADPRAAPVSPVHVQPIDGVPPARPRLPADVVSVAAAPADASKLRVASLSPLQAMVIRGASVLVRPAGSTSRVVREHDESVHVGGKAFIGNVTAGIRHGVVPLSDIAAPTLASAGELRWYRAAVGRVTNVVTFGPARVASSGMRIARMAALHAADVAERMGRVSPVATCEVAMPMPDRAAIRSRSPGRARAVDVYETSV